MNNKKRVNFNLSIDLYNFLKQYSEERGITFTTAVDRFLSRSIEQYQMGTVIRDEAPFKEDTPLKEEAPLKEETNISSFNGGSDHDNNVVCGLFLKPMNEDDQAILETFNDMPD